MSQVFNCFGLVIHGYDLDHALSAIRERSSQKKPVTVVTANPEILLAARRDPAYWNVLRAADFRFVDGFGLKIAGWLNGAKPARLTGVTLAEALVQQAAAKGTSVALIGGEEGNADKAAWKLRRSYPELRVFAERGGVITNTGEDDDAGAETRFRLTQFAPEILLVAFGHPKQERWMARYLPDLPSVHVAIGIGGTIDYWAGAKRRAPDGFRKMGLEWLWRLFQEPQRWKRIFDAVIIFPLTVLSDRLLPRRPEETSRH